MHHGLYGIWLYKTTVFVWHDQCDLRDDGFNIVVWGVVQCMLDKLPKHLRNLYNKQRLSGNGRCVQQSQM